MEGTTHEIPWMIFIPLHCWPMMTTSSSIRGTRTSLNEYQNHEGITEEDCYLEIIRLEEIFISLPSIKQFEGTNELLLAFSDKRFGRIWVLSFLVD